MALASTHYPTESKLTLLGKSVKPFPPGYMGFPRLWMEIMTVFPQLV
jgi:hypothetical protein